MGFNLSTIGSLIGGGIGAYVGGPAGFGIGSQFGGALFGLGDRDPAQQQYDYMRDFYQHRYQWQAQDMAAAGINPLVGVGSVGSGGNVDVSGAVNSSTNRMNALVNSAVALSNMKLQQQQIDESKTRSEVNVQDAKTKEFVRLYQLEPETRRILSDIAMKDAMSADIQSAKRLKDVSAVLEQAKVPRELAYSDVWKGKGKYLAGLMPYGGVPNDAITKLIAAAIGEANSTVKRKPVPGAAYITTQ